MQIGHRKKFVYILETPIQETILNCLFLYLIKFSASVEQGWAFVSVMDPNMPSIAMALIKQEQDSIDMSEGNLVFIRRLEQGAQIGKLVDMHSWS